MKFLRNVVLYRFWKLYYKAKFRRAKKLLYAEEFHYMGDALEWAKECRALVYMIGSNFHCRWNDRDYRLIVKYYEDDGAWAWVVNE